MPEVAPKEWDETLEFHGRRALLDARIRKCWRGAGGVRGFVHESIPGLTELRRGEWRPARTPEEVADLMAQAGLFPQEVESSCGAYRGYLLGRNFLALFFPAFRMVRLSERLANLQNTPTAHLPRTLFDGFDGDNGHAFTPFS